MNMEWNGVDDDNSSPTSEQHMLTEKAFFNGTRFRIQNFLFNAPLFFTFPECWGVRAREDNTGAREFINYELLERVSCVYTVEEAPSSRDVR